MRSKRQKKCKKRSTASKSDVNKTLQNKTKKVCQKGSTEEKKSSADLGSKLIPTNKQQNDSNLSAPNIRRSKRISNCGTELKAADEAALTTERKELYTSVSNSSLNKLDNDVKRMTRNTYRSTVNWSNLSESRAIELNQDDSMTLPLQVDRKERLNTRTYSILTNELQKDSNDSAQITYLSDSKRNRVSESRAIEQQQNESRPISICQMQRKNRSNTISHLTITNEFENDSKLSAQTTPQSKRKWTITSESRATEQQCNDTYAIAECQMKRKESLDTFCNSLVTNEVQKDSILSAQNAPKSKREWTVKSESRAIEQQHNESNGIAECHVARKESFDIISNSFITNEQQNDSILSAQTTHQSKRERNSTFEFRVVEQQHNESNAIAECLMARKGSLDTISNSFITNGVQNDSMLSAQTALKSKKQWTVKSESRACEQQNESNAIAECHMARKESLDPISNSFITSELQNDSILIAQTTHQAKREWNSSFESRAVEQQQNDLTEISIPQMERKAHYTNLHKKEGLACEFLVKIETEYLNLMQHHAKDCSLCSNMIFQTQENQLDVLKSRMKDKNLEIRNLQLNSKLNMTINPTLANPYLSSQEFRKETCLKAHRMHESSKVTSEPNNAHANHEKSQLCNKNDPSMVYTEFEGTPVYPEYQPTPVYPEYQPTPKYELTPMYKQNNGSHLKQIFSPRQFPKYDSVHCTTSGKLKVTKPQGMYVNDSNSHENGVQILGVTHPKVIPSRYQNNKGASNQGNLKDINKESQYETSGMVFKKQEARSKLMDHFIDISMNTLKKNPVNSIIASSDGLNATKCRIPAQTTHQPSDQLVNRQLNKGGPYVVPNDDTNNSKFNSKPYVYKPIPMRFQIDSGNWRMAKNSILSVSQPSGNILFSSSSYISDYLKLPGNEKASMPSNADVKIKSSQDVITLSNLPNPSPLSSPITISDIEINPTASETIKLNLPNPLRRSGRKRTMLQCAQQSESDFETDEIQNCAHEDNENSDSGSSWEHETDFRTKKRPNKIKSFVSSEDPTKVNNNLKGKFKCWLCKTKCTFCSNTKTHIINKHNEGLGSIDLIKTAETGKIHIVLYCPRSCPYATYDIDGLKKHIATCNQPLLIDKGIKYLDLNNHFVQHIYPELINTEPHVLVGPFKRGPKKRVM